MYKQFLESVSDLILIERKQHFQNPKCRHICKRVLLLATKNAIEGQIFDVLPLEDERRINRSNWYMSDKGIARVLNEVKEISRIINESEGLISKYKKSL